MLRILTPLELRVLGVLVEKQATVPDSYPLSVNALVNGCNQKTARDPVMETGEAEVLRALESLKSASLVFESSGSRVVRWEHNMARVLQLPGAAVALLATLMLRGAQTAAELRANCERLHRFADISSVEAFLDELAAKEPPRVRRLSRAPGSREARWVRLLGGEPPASLTAAAPGAEPLADGGSVDAEWSALRAEQARLAAEVLVLRGWVQRIATDLGLTLEPPESLNNLR